MIISTYFDVIKRLWISKAFNEVYQLGLPESAYKIATGFGSGMRQLGCSYGTITGAVMVRTSIFIISKYIDIIKMLPYILKF